MKRYIIVYEDDNDLAEEVAFATEEDAVRYICYFREAYNHDFSGPFNFKITETEEDISLFNDNGIFDVPVNPYIVYNFYDGEYHITDYVSDNFSFFDTLNERYSDTEYQVVVPYGTNPETVVINF